MTEETVPDKVAIIQHLDPEHVDDYVAAHEDVPDPVIHRMTESGVDRFMLFVQGDISVGYVEVENFDKFVQEYSEDPECGEWEERVGEFKRSGVDTENSDIPTMDMIWSLEEAKD